MKLSNGLAWEYFNAGMQCSVAEESAVGGKQTLALWRQCGGMAES